MSDKRAMRIHGDREQGRELSKERSEHLDNVHLWLKKRVREGAIRAVSLTVLSGGTLVDRWADGWIGDPPYSGAVAPKTRFLVASLTKPVTAAAMLRLVEEGELTLATPVASILPAFAGGDRDAVQLWHLLTHTSGLPDMLPNNQELRVRQAGLPDFFQSICGIHPAFEPGTRMSYQSMGFLVMALMAERLTGMAFREFVTREIFRPAGMTDSYLGLSEEDCGKHDAQVELPRGQAGTNWHWNTHYWRRLGAPWGGLITTAADLAAFLHVFLHEGRSFRGRRVLSPGSVVAMVRDWFSSHGAGFFPCGLGWLIKGGLRPQPVEFAKGTRDSSGVVSPPEVIRDRSFLGLYQLERLGTLVLQGALCGEIHGLGLPPSF